MAALKRKSSGGHAVIPAKSSKTKETSSNSETKTAARKKKKELKKSGDDQGLKSLSITFPEEGKVEWNTIRKQSKELTEARKQKKHKDHYHLIQEAKKKFEIFRQHSCKGAERDALVTECAQMMKGLLTEKARSHDVSRLVQWLLKLGSNEVRNIVVNEIVEDIVSLAKCKYSSHILKNVVVSCDSTVRRRIIGKFSGNVLKLLSSKVSAPIVEDIYLKYASSAEKAAMRRELYGDLCKPLIPTDQEWKLGELLELHKALAPSILTGMKTTLSKCLEKPWLLASPIVLSVLIDYLSNCSDKDRAEMFEPLRGNINSIIKSKVGADVGLLILKHSSAKEKKDIIKDLKGNIANVAVTPSGCGFLLHLIDSVDDTVLLKKALLPSVIENADDLLTNDSGRKLMSYIVAHRDSHFFHPNYVNKLKTADDSVFVKKSSDIRMRELQEACVPTLLVKIKDDPQLWLKDGCCCLLTASILQVGSGDKLQEAFHGIARFLTDPESRTKRLLPNTDETPPVESPAINKILKKIIKTDKLRQENGDPTFSEVLVSFLDEDVVGRWTSTNRGCFVFVFLLESEVKGVVDDVKSRLTSSKIVKGLKKSNFKGAEIILGLL